MAEISGKTAKRAAYGAVLRKLKEGKKLTAADYKLIDEMEAEERAAQNAAAKVVAINTEPNYGSTLEEDLEEWTLRDSIVRGKSRTLSAIATLHQVERGAIDKMLWKIQRGLLARYGFEGTKKSGPLTGNEALALQWVKSIAQLARASAEWELQMEEAEKCREKGKSFPLDMFAALVATLKQLAEKRDGLSLKVRELSAKEKKVGTGRGQKAHNIEILVHNGEEA